MKKFFYLLLLPLCLGFAACGDDDDDNGISAGTSSSLSWLVGTWELSEFLYLQDGEVVESIISGGERFIFNGNHTVQWQEGERDDNGNMKWYSYPGSLTYTVKDNIVTIKDFETLTYDASAGYLYYEEAQNGLTCRVIFKKVK